MEESPPPPAPSGKKPYKELNLAEKVSLIEMAEARPAMSQAELARAFGIAKSNVCRVLKRRTEYQAVLASAAFPGARKRKLRDPPPPGLLHRLRQPPDSLLGRLLASPNLHEKRRRLLAEQRPGLPSHHPANPNLRRLLSLIVRPPPPPPKDENNNVPPPGQGNETLRAHMLKQHQITRMFMCRCCNWAFPDKTSLHIHMQAMATGSPGNVSVIAKSSIDAEPGAALMQEAAIAAQEALAAAADGDADQLLHPDLDEEAGEPEDMEAGLLPQDHQAWLANNFPQVDASGVGSLGGNLCLAEEEEEEEAEMEGGMGGEEAQEPVPEEERADSGYDEDRMEEAGPEVRPSPLNSLLYQARLRTGPAGPRRGLDSIFPAAFGEEAPLPGFLKRSESPSNTSASSCHPSPPNEGVPDPKPATAAPAPAQLSSPGCLNCRVLKGRLGFTESRNRFLEGKVSSLETKVSRLETRVVSSDSAAKRLEGDSKALRDNNDRLHHKLLKAQEKALLFMQKGFGDSEATNSFLNDLLNSTYLGSA